MSKGQQISENFYVRGDGTVSGSPTNIFCKDIQYIINIFVQQYANFKWLHETTQHMFFCSVHITFQMNIWWIYFQNVDLLLRKYVCTTSKLKTVHWSW
jgi:hypothetical protein